MDGEAVGGGDERVDAALALLDTLPRLPVAEHVALFEQVHQGLQEVLASADGESGA